jgi:oligoendopeptidase F
MIGSNPLVGYRLADAAQSFNVGRDTVARTEIPETYQWDLERIYPDWNVWDDDFAAVEAAISRLESLKDTIKRSAQDLRHALEAILQVRHRLEILYIFSSLKSDEDTRIGDHIARRGKASTLAVRFAEAVSWFEPELLALGPATITRFKAREPALEIYAHYLDSIQRRRDHTLPPEQEALLAAAADMARGAGQVFSALNNADLTFPSIRDESGREVELTKARYNRYIKSPVRRVRRDAFVACLDTYGAVINTLAANMDANIKNHVFFAQSRRYASTLDAALYPNAIPVEVFHTLIRTTNSNLDIVHRYTDLKKRVLDLDPFCEYDLYAPLFPAAEFKFSYEEAQECLLAALTPLGDEYLQIVREGFDGRWIDVHENVGKRSGAYSNGVYGTSPYILLNWSDQLRDTFTLAHEMGHSIHTYLSTKHQPYVYSDYPIFTAEVASTCNEMLLLHYLLENTSSRERQQYLLDFYLTQINDIVFRQTMFAEFEYEIHCLGERGETLTAELLEELYQRMLTHYWGQRVTFDPHRSGKNWARIPHFYYRYYVYQYATAYAAATVLSQRILAGDQAARDRYLDLLRSGSSRYPVDTLKRAGVDMTQSQPIEGVFVLFTQLLDRLEDLLNREEA